MFSLIRALAGARTVRPLLAWVLAVLAFVVFRPPQEFILLLVVGLGVALAMTVSRLREGRREVTEKAGRAWQLAERLAGAVEDRIRHGDQEPAAPLYGPHTTYRQVPASTGVYGQAPVDHGMYGQVPAGQPVYGQVGGPAVAYDPAALLSAVVAVLAAEGLPTDPGPALLPAAHLLADLGISPRPGIPAPTALGLAGALTPGPPRRARVLPAGLVAAVIRLVLTHDRVLPEQVSTDTADTLADHTAAVLIALRVQPGDAGSLTDWPVIAQIIDAAPLPVPYEQWGR